MSSNALCISARPAGKVDNFRINLSLANHLHYKIHTTYTRRNFPCVRQNDAIRSQAVVVCSPGERTWIGGLLSWWFDFVIVH